MPDTVLKPDLDTPYRLTADQIDCFRDQGYIKLKQVLSPEAIEYYGKRITEKVIELNTERLPLEKRNTYGKAFLQIVNIWTKDEIVKQFVFSRRLARIAAELLGTAGVRLYHDQALYKEGGGGFTPWHVDQQYWPLATHKTVTAWVPLQETPREMGALCFAAKSHHFEEYRHLAISDESERRIQQAMDTQQFGYVEEPFDLGEVSYHYGWTYHRAGPNTSGDPRRVMTVIYMDRDMRVADAAEKPADWEAFLDKKPDGAICNGPLNPVLWEE